MSATTKTSSAKASQADSPSRSYGLIAEFETPAQIMKAAERVRDSGYKWWDCCTPFPVHGLDKAMGIRQTILPIIVFFIRDVLGTLDEHTLRTQVRIFPYPDE